MLDTLKHRAVLALKGLLYARRGEPYAVGATTLRYAPGTRPILAKYRTSANIISRYDALQMDLFAREVTPGGFVLDIGAHAGQCALVMAALSGPTGKVIAFEPDHFAREALERNLKLNPHVTPPIVEPLALSDTEGTATLFSRGGDANSSLARSGIGETRADELVQFEVRLATLDGYLAEQGLPMPDLVKIDTEGAEIRILMGARAVLASKATIVCELHPYAWHGFGTTLGDLQALLAGTGRRMRYLDGSEVDEVDPQYGIVLLERAT